jgi:chromosome segregation ATPase
MSTTSTKLSKQKSLSAPISTTTNSTPNESEDQFGGLQEALLALNPLMQKIAKHSSALTEFDNLRRDITSLTDSLAKKEEEIKVAKEELDRIKKEDQVVNARFAQLAAQWHADKKELETRLVTTLKMNQETGARQVEAAEKRAKDAEDKFGVCKTKLFELRSQTAVTNLPNDLSVSSRFVEQMLIF